MLHTHSRPNTVVICGLQLADVGASEAGLFGVVGEILLLLFLRLILSVLGFLAFCSPIGLPARVSEAAGDASFDLDLRSSSALMAASFSSFALAAAASASACRARTLSCVELNTKFPGSPRRGFSSIYSSP